METARIPDEFYDDAIAMYRKRGKLWQHVSIGLLFITVMFIFAGIFFFYQGDAQSRKSAQSEVDLQTQVNEKDRQIQDLVNLAGRTEGRSQDYQSAQFIAARLDTIAMLLVASEPKEIASKKQVVSFGQIVADNALRVQQSSKETEGKTPLLPLPVSDYGGTGNGLFTERVYVELLDSAGTVNWQAVRDALGEIVAIARKYGTDEDLSERDAESIAAQARTVMESGAKQFSLMKPGLDQSVNDSAERLSAFRSDWQSRENKLNSLRAAKVKLEGQLDVVKADRNYVLFMAWIPDLTIRVGSVILLLFITKILLATYRYTIGLSTFYTGIADAIQLLQPGGDGTWYDIEHLNTLLTRLVPTSLAVDPISTPADQLSTLAQAWIAKKMPG